MGRYRGHKGRVAVLLALVLASLVAVPSAQASAGALFAFGRNDSGQLGTGTTSSTFAANPTPAQTNLPGATGPVAQVAAGASHTLVLTSTGQLYAFGANYIGQLGTNANSGTSNPTVNPTPITLPGAGGQIIQIAAGDAHSLALTSTGQLYSFGDNFYGQLGTPGNSGTLTPNPTPTLVTLPGAIGRITQIAAGGFHSLALTSSGQVFGFGSNLYGQLGNPGTSGNANPNPTPTQASLAIGPGQVTQIGAGGFHSFVATSTGHLFSFGENLDGQLGNPTNSGNTSDNPSPLPVTLPGSAGQVAQIVAGVYHSLVVTSAGQLYAFGDNRYGQLGNTANNGTDNPNPTPTRVTIPGATISHVGAGTSHSLALASTGRLYALGYNRYGQLGIATNSGTENANTTPAAVAIPAPASTFIAAISTGSFADHSLVSLAPAAPSLTGLRVSPKKSSAAGRRVKGRCVRKTHKNRNHKHCTRKVKLKVSYTLNTAASVTLTLKLQLKGRKVKGRCVKQTRRNRKHKHCKLLKSAGRLTQTSTAGNSTVVISRKLKPGSYTLTALATANGRTSSPQTITFKVTK